MKALEALWAVRFGDVAIPDQFNGGVVIFETSRIFGGDSSFYYKGEYEVSDEEFTAKITVTYFNGDDLTAFGFRTRDSFHVEVNGRRYDDTIVGNAWLLAKPSERVDVILKWLEDLP